MNAPAGPLGKECQKCGEWKALTGFSPSKKGRLGRHSYCKACMNIDSKKRAAIKLERDPEGFRQHRAEIVRRSREKRGSARERAYSRAYRRATARLIDAHRRQFDAFLRLEMAVEDSGESDEAAGT